jgi:hypothetical protein
VSDIRAGPVGCLRGAREPEPGATSPTSLAALLPARPSCVKLLPGAVIELPHSELIMKDCALVDPMFRPLGFGIPPL